MKRRILLLMMTALLSVGAWAVDDVTLPFSNIVLQWEGGSGSKNDETNTLTVKPGAWNGWKFEFGRPVSTTEFSGISIDCGEVSGLQLYIFYDSDQNWGKFQQITEITNGSTIDFNNTGTIASIMFTTTGDETGSIVINSVTLKGKSEVLEAYPTSNLTLPWDKMKDPGWGGNWAATYDSENKTIAITQYNWSGWFLNSLISTKYYKGIRFTLTQAPASGGSIKIDYDEGEDAWISTDAYAGGGTISYDFTGDRNITQIVFNGADWSSSDTRTYGISTCYIEPKPITATVTDAKYATFAVGAAIDYSTTDPLGLKAYIANVEDNKVKLTGVTKVPANTAVILYADVNASTVYTLTPTAETTDDVSANKLHVSDGTVTGSSGNIYVLANGSNDVGFYKLGSSVTVPAGKAYLQISSESPALGAPEFFGFGDGTTGITMVQGEGFMDNGSDNYYDLQGRRVAQPTKGLYIVNGKKVIIN